MLDRNVRGERWAANCGIHTKTPTLDDEKAQGWSPEETCVLGNAVQPMHRWIHDGCRVPRHIVVLTDLDSVAELSVAWCIQE